MVELSNNTKSLAFFLFALGFGLVALAVAGYAFASHCFAGSQCLHRDHFFSGEGIFTQFTPPHASSAAMGASGPDAGAEPVSYDNIFLEDLPEGEYRIQVLGMYRDQPDEHLVLESSSGDAVTLFDLNGPGCAEGAQCWGEVQVDVCTGGAFPANGSVHIRAYSKVPPAMGSLPVLEVRVQRVGGGGCPSAGPSATNLQITELDYCGASSPPVRMEWDFDDPGDTQSAYQIQADDDSGFGSIEIDSGKVLSASEEYAPQGAQAMNYATTYYWRVKVWDSGDTESAWAVGSPFTTPSHAYPNPSAFSWTPATPVAGQAVTFFANTVFGMGSTGHMFAWDFEDDGVTDSSLENPQHTYPSVNPYTIALEACDGAGFCCTESKNIDIALPFPGWKEISPL